MIFPPITPADFRAQIAALDDVQLTVFIDELEYVIEELEHDDFFGTEGFNKRFA